MTWTPCVNRKPMLARTSGFVDDILFVGSAKNKRARVLVRLSENKLNDSFSASPAIAGNSIFFRGEKFLYCVEQPKR